MVVVVRVLFGCSDVCGSGSVHVVCGGSSLCGGDILCLFV